MSSENNSSSKKNSKPLTVRILLVVKSTSSDWESWYLDFCAAAACLGIAYDEFRNEEPYDWDKAHKDLLSKYAEDTDSPLDKNFLDYQLLKSAVAKMREQKDTYDKERRYLYSALVASVHSDQMDDFRLTHRSHF
jgi:hypothetical protein